MYSQEVNSVNWNLENGLPSNETYQVTQDNKGFIWICTDHGVVRYNGQDFELFSTANGLVENTVFRIYQDYKNRLWFLGMSGTLCYWDKDTIIQHPANTQIEKILNYRASFANVAVDSNDVLYFTTRVKNIDGKEYYRVGVEDTILYLTILDDPNLKNTSLLLLNETTSLLLTNANKAVKGQTWKGELKEHQVAVANLLDVGGVKREYISSDSKQVFFKNDLVFIYDRIKNSLFQLKLKQQDKVILSAYLDQKEQLWLSTTKGLLFYGAAPFLDKPKLFFKDVRIASIYEDKEGNYWLATLNKGVFVISHWELLHFFKEEAMKIVKIVAYNDQIIGVGGNRVYQLNQHYPFEKAVRTIDPSIDLYDLKKWQNKLLVSNGFIGEQKGGDLLFDKKYYTSHRYSGKSIFVDKDEEKIMVGYAKGLWEIDKNFQKEQLCKNHWINAIEKKAKNEWWLGTTKGLFYYHKDRGELVSLGKQNRLLSQSILAINYFQNYLLVGTKGNGIIVLDPTTFQVLQQWTTLDGLSNVFVHCLTAENDSTLWVGTNQGANRLTIVEGKIKFSKTFDVHNYLPSNGVNDILIQGAMLWFATDRGIAQLPQKVLSPAKFDFEIPIYIKQIRINGNAVTLKDHYTLSYNQYNIVVDFLALSFNATNSVSYRYRLSNQKSQSKDWVYTKLPQINCNNLAPDYYELMIETKKKNGEWQKKGIKLSFEIYPHFTQTWSFLLLITTLIVLAVAIYIRHIIAQKNLEKELAEAEQKSLRSQLKPHFLFNAINSVVYFLYKNQKKQALKFLQKFAALMRSTLENSQHSLILLEKEINHLQLYLEMEYERLSSGSSYRHDFEIVHLNKIDVKKWNIPPMLLQPLVENAIIHGLAPKEGNRKLLIVLEEIDNGLRIKIEDNGIGRARAKEIKKQFFVKKTSQGLNLLKQRINTINKLLHVHIKISVEDVVDDFNCSTRFILHFPSTLKNK